jgi:hypothetical protein
MATSQCALPAAALGRAMPKVHKVVQKLFVHMEKRAEDEQQGLRSRFA